MYVVVFNVYIFVACCYSYTCVILHVVLLLHRYTLQLLVCLLIVSFACRVASVCVYQMVGVLILLCSLWLSVCIAVLHKVALFTYGCVDVCLRLRMF